MTTNHKGLPVSIGWLSTTVAAGPFRDAPNNGKVFRLRLAPEVDRPAEYTMPIPDFGVPEQPAMQKAVRVVLQALLSGRRVYVGCYGGIGRTGLFLGCLHKVERAYSAVHYGHRGQDALKVVRAAHHPHAVETADQREFLAKFDPLPILDRLPGMERKATGRASGARRTRARYWIARRLPWAFGGFTRAFPAYRPGA